MLFSRSDNTNSLSVSFASQIWATVFAWNLNCKNPGTEREHVDAALFRFESRARGSGILVAHTVSKHVSGRYVQPYAIGGGGV